MRGLGLGFTNSGGTWGRGVCVLVLVAIFNVLGYIQQLNCKCCCFPSKTYGRNVATSIFRSFHRTASSTTCGWSRRNILMCFYISF